MPIIPATGEAEVTAPGQPGIQSSRDAISTHNWAWWPVSVISNDGGKTWIVVLGKKRDPVSKITRPEKKGLRGLEVWLKWKSTCLASAKL
jgi:hypothetical protein